MSMFFSSFPSSGGSSGVSSLNGQTGALTLVAGSNITLTPGSGTLTIASTGGGGANTALSNLASVAINDDLLPDVTNTRSLGSSTKTWTNFFLGNAIADSSFQPILLATTRKLVDEAGNSALGFSSTGRILYANNGSTSQLNWNTPALLTVSASIKPVSTFGFQLGDASLAWAAVTTNAVNFQGTGSGAINMVAPATVTPYSVILPDTQGAASTVLTNDGSGNLSWASGSSGANTALSNLVTTAINQDFIFDTGAPTLITTKDGAADTQPMTLASGNAGGSGASGAVNINSGVGTAGGNSGNIHIASGIDSAVTGSVTINSGNNSIGPTGALSVKSGSSSVNASGAVFYGSGDGAGGNTGVVNITSGDAGSNSGNILLTVGTAGGTQGNIKLLKSGVPSVAGQLWTASSTDGTGYWSDSIGATGSFTTVDLKTVTVVNGLITSIV